MLLYCRIIKSHVLELVGNAAADISIKIIHGSVLCYLFFITIIDSQLYLLLTTVIVAVIITVASTTSLT